MSSMIKFSILIMEDSNLKKCMKRWGAKNIALNCIIGFVLFKKLLKLTRTKKQYRPW